jgi:hypothetical protein
LPCRAAIHKPADRLQQFVKDGCSGCANPTGDPPPGVQFVSL